MDKWNEAVDKAWRLIENLQFEHFCNGVHKQITNEHLTPLYQQAIERAEKAEAMLDEAIEILAINGIYPTGAASYGSKTINEMWQKELARRVKGE